jgi:hypothetical protein
LAKVAWAILSKSGGMQNYRLSIANLLASARVSKSSQYVALLQRTHTPVEMRPQNAPLRETAKISVALL